MEERKKMAYIHGAVLEALRLYLGAALVGSGSRGWVEGGSPAGEGLRSVERDG